MTAQLIAIDASALDTLVAEVRQLKEEVQKARIQPEPKWITITQYAKKVSKSESTIQRWARQGKLEKRGNLVPNPTA